MKLSQKPAATEQKYVDEEEQELTIHRSAGFIHQTVAFNYAIGEGGLAPGHVDGGGGQLTEVDEAGSAGSWSTHRGQRSINKTCLRDSGDFLLKDVTESIIKVQLK